ncbi:type IV pilus secretin PilQ [Marinobacterium marinum]|uniref:Type IV pilus secretin PilQ n=1 Tax=Marinobacterium marinum TaxID=2756129 RepID=A0A7W1WZY6_9GAMM|nr:type IV pilus secretin PilQ [Marinobacterium marinum]MBA4503334.1 type IV pilus secretin PilQ [Marinobacterium marinum]
MQTVNRHRRIEINRMQTRSLVPFWLLLSALMLTLVGRTAQAAMLEDVSFVSLPGKKIEVQMNFDGAPSEPKVYLIETPPRLVIDLAETGSAMAQKTLAVKSGDVDSLHFAEANGRMRIVTNLNAVVGYDIRAEGNSLLLELGGDSAVARTHAAEANQAASAPRNAPAEPSQVRGIDFHRLDGDRGRVTIELNDEGANLDIVEEGGNVVVNLTGANLNPALQQRLDVQDFATPVNYIDTVVNGSNATILINPTASPYDYMAYQSGSQLVLDFQPLTPAEQKAKEDFFPYKGEKIDLNFQNVEIRTVLQIIAEVAEKNLVVSDNVQGDITLRLKNVPWDQALDIVLKTKGLDKRETGNVLLVGTVGEIAQREAVELQSQQSEITVAPLVTEFIQIDYRKASVIKERVEEAKLVSERGFAMADDETNVLMVRETAKQVEEIRDTIKQFDVEVAQVMVQARLVTASNTAAKELGIRWGAGFKNDRWSIGGSPNFPSTPVVHNPILSQDMADAVEDSDALKENMTIPGNLMVDLGVDRATSGLAFGFLTDRFLLSAELLAMESDGKLEIVSQPKVITTNGKPAVIKAGQEVPTRTIDADGKMTVEWKEVVLKLDVVPQIIPGDKVQLDLIITEDSVGEVYDELGNRLINKQELRTSIVVSDGETVVLGGVLRNQTSETISKTPLLGDLPVVGNLFKSRVSDNDKRELLIFITPQMIRESLRR